MQKSNTTRKLANNNENIDVMLVLFDIGSDKRFSFVIAGVNYDVICSADNFQWKNWWNRENKKNQNSIGNSIKNLNYNYFFDGIANGYFVERIWWIRTWQFSLLPLLLFCKKKKKKQQPLLLFSHKSSHHKSPVSI